MPLKSTGSAAMTGTIAPGDNIAKANRADFHIFRSRASSSNGTKVYANKTGGIRQVGREKTNVQSSQSFGDQIPPEQ